MRATVGTSDGRPSEAGRKRDGQSSGKPLFVNAVGKRPRQKFSEGEKPPDGTPTLTKEDIPRLRQQWKERYKDLFTIPLKLPPFREVNHEIKLIDEGKRFKYRLPKCPDILKDQLIDKINRYTAAGWWKPTTAGQAVPMICTFKMTAEPKLRTVFDLRLQNENTVKDVTPFPDQDCIRNDVARAPFRSKIDLTEAYEQIRIAPEDVKKTVFATIFGTFESHVTQQGDCNAPSTCQRLMTRIFFDIIGKYVHVYMDDIFIFSYSIEEHENHIKSVLERLRKAQLYVSKKKEWTVWDTSSTMKAFTPMKKRCNASGIGRNRNHSEKSNDFWAWCNTSPILCQT
jgi:hypothetical protein